MPSSVPRPRGLWCCQRAVSAPTPLEVLGVTRARYTPVTPTPTRTQASALIKEVEKTFGLNDDEDDDKEE